MPQELQISTQEKNCVLPRSSLSINKHPKPNTLEFGIGDSCQPERTQIRLRVIIPQGSNLQRNMQYFPQIESLHSDYTKKTVVLMQKFLRVTDFLAWMCAQVQSENSTLQFQKLEATGFY